MAEVKKHMRVSKDEKSVQAIISIELYKKFTDQLYLEDPKKAVKDKLEELIVEYVNKR